MGSSTVVGPSHPRDLFVTADVGGSSIRLGIVRNRAIVWKQSRMVPTSRSPSEVADTIWEMLISGLHALGEDPRLLRALVVGVPGPMQRKLGLSRMSPNLGWRNVAFLELLKSRMRAPVPIFLEHDVRVAAYGEHRYGAGRGLSNLIYVRVGTGVGAAFILNQTVYYGPSEAAGEIGHIQLAKDGPLCGCGNRGCLEQFASARAVSREAERLGLRGAENKPPLVPDVVEAANSGDPNAVDLLQSAARALAEGISVAVNILDVREVVVGGHLSHSGHLYWQALEEEAATLVMPIHRAELHIAPSLLGDDAAILGGASLAQDNHQLD